MTGVIRRTALFGFTAALVAAGHHVEAGGEKNAPPLFAPGQRAAVYLVMPRARGIAEAADLNDITICTRPDGGLTDNSPLAEQFAGRGARYTALPFDRPGSQLTAFETGRCDALAIYDYYDIARAGRVFDGSTYIALPIAP